MLWFLLPRDNDIVCPKLCLRINEKTKVTGQADEKELFATLIEMWWSERDKNVTNDIVMFRDEENKTGLENKTEDSVN